jgi:hypothetical protein
MSSSQRRKVKNPQLKENLLGESSTEMSPVSSGASRRAKAAAAFNEEIVVSTKPMKSRNPALEANEEEQKLDSWDIVIVFPFIDLDYRPVDQLGGDCLTPREVVLSILSAGLEVRMFKSSRKDMIFCKVRSSIGRLKKFAEEVDFKLLLDKRKLNEVFLNGMKIDGEDGYTERLDPIQINDDPKVCIYHPSEYIYAPYPGKKRLQSLFEFAPGANHPFSSSVRIKLILCMLEHTGDTGCGIDLRKTIADGTIKSVYPLSDESVASEISSKWFTSAPWSQPIAEVRNYFGEKIAMYFSFLGFYTTMLRYLALASLVAMIDIIIESAVYGSLKEALSTAYTFPAFALFVAIWAQSLVEFWKREEASLAMAWGTTGCEDVEKERREYYLDPFTYQTISMIDGSPIVYFPPKIRQRRTIYSTFVIVSMIFVVLCFVSALFALRYELVNSDNATLAAFGGIIVSVINAIQIAILNDWFSGTAIKLTNSENHRTDTQYADSLIIKLFCFSFVNSYAPLFYIAFIKYYIGAGCLADSCMAELSETLLIIFFTNLTFGNVVELLSPYISNVMRKWKKDSDGDNVSVFGVSEAERQFQLTEYDPVMAIIGEYSELSIQLGYVTLFVVACPIAPFLAYICNVVEIRSDGYKLLRLHRRPIPLPCEDIGSWATIFQLMAIIACVTNSGILCFTMQLFETSNASLVWIFVIFQYFLIITALLLEYFVDDVPEDVTIQLQRTEFIVKAITEGLGNSNAPTVNPGVIDGQALSLPQLHDEDEE